MSRDGLLPKSFSKIHPRFKTPSFSTIVTGIVVGLPIFFTDETFVLDFTSIGTLFAFVLVTGGVLLLPKRGKGEGKGFRLPYINGKWIFLFLLVLSVILIQLNIPDYFPSLWYGEWSDVFVASHRILWLFLTVLQVLATWKSFNLIPLLGVSICLYLLTGMTADNWLWFGLWFLLGLVVYFSFGRKNSVLNERG